MFRSLASSSQGNAYLVSDGETCLLLECGLPYAKLTKLTRQNGTSLPQITACLVTHEHKDHALSTDKLLGNGIPVYASEGTARALQLPDMEIIEPHDTLCFGAFRIRTFPVWHDAAQPVGFLIDNRHTRERLFFATDTNRLPYIVESPTYIAIECNYEEAALAASRLPESLKNRIRHTHTEINDAIRFLKKQDLSQTLAVWLLHLSAKNSRAAVWKTRIQQTFPHVQVHICDQ